MNSIQVTEIGTFPANWKIVELGEIADVTKLAGFEFTKCINYDEKGGIIALRASNVVNGQLDLTDVKRISKEASDGLERSKLYKDDILLTYTGKLGDVAIVDADNRYHLAPNICRIRLLEGNHLYFVYSYLRSSLFRSILSSYTVGSTQLTIPMKSIRKIKVPLPGINEQKVISEILRPIDQKLELNRQINQTLEQIAQAIFKSWFVDFVPVRAKVAALEDGRDPLRAAMCAISGKCESELDALPRERFESLKATAALFPERLEGSELGEIPEGWQPQRLEYMLELSYGKSLTKKNRKEGPQFP